MKNVFLVIVYFLALTLVAFAVDGQVEHPKVNLPLEILNEEKQEVINPIKEETEAEKELRIYRSKFKKSRLKARTSPKLEHLKTKVENERDLQKRKEEFQLRKEKELMHLDEEYEILDYKP